MEHYTINITDEALEDMEEIYNYIAYVLRSPETAQKQYDRIADAIFKLEELPERIKVLESACMQDKGLRRLLVDNYSVLYSIDENCVNITNVLYSASDIAHRL